MRIRISSILALIAVSSLFFLGAGCEGEQGPAGPPGNSPTVLSIVGGVEVYWNGGIADYLNATIGITNAPSVPDVKVNDMIIPMYDGWLFDGGRLGYYEGIESETGFEEATLEVTYTKQNGQPGVATATVTLPEEIDPVDNISIYPYNDVDVEWTSSNGADAYWVVCDFYTRWIDASSVTHYDYYDSDTVLTDTTLTISADYIFPDQADVTTLGTFYGYVYIYPVSGPWMPGVADNINGDGIGVFVATADYEYVYVNLATTSKEVGDAANTKEKDNAPAIDIIKIAEELAGRKLR